MEKVVRNKLFFLSSKTSSSYFSFMPNEPDHPLSLVLPRFPLITNFPFLKTFKFYTIR